MTLASSSKSTAIAPPAGRACIARPRAAMSAQGTEFVAPGKRPTRQPLPESPSAPLERLAEAHADRGLSLGALSLMPQNWAERVPTTRGSSA